MKRKPDLPFPESQEIGEEESACVLDVEIDSANDGFALQSSSDDESKNDYVAGYLNNKEKVETAPTVKNEEFSESNCLDNKHIDSDIIGSPLCNRSTKSIITSSSQGENKEKM
eukprot:2747273-Ditylum_brightwellii.AAC.1